MSLSGWRARFGTHAKVFLRHDRRASCAFAKHTHKRRYNFSASTFRDEISPLAHGGHYSPQGRSPRKSSDTDEAREQANYAAVGFTGEAAASGEAWVWE